MRPPYDGLAQFLERLDARCRYAIVKNPQLWSNLERGGDWDLLVSDPGPAQRALTESVGFPRRVQRRSYVVSYYFDWGEIDLLQALEWRGIELLPRADVLDRATRGPEGWWTATLAHQAVMGWIGPLLASGSFKQRYAALVQAAASTEGPELERRLTELLGPRWGTEAWRRACIGEFGAEAAFGAVLRRAALRHALVRRPARTALRAAAFAHRESALRASPALPFLRVADREQAAAASAWCGEHRNAVPGLALYDGNRIQLHRSNAAPSAGWPAPVQRPPGLEERVTLANLQSRGWLVASTRPTRGVRGAPSALLGRPELARSGLRGLLDDRLAMHTRRALGGSGP